MICKFCLQFTDTDNFIFIFIKNCEVAEKQVPVSYNILIYSLIFTIISDLIEWYLIPLTTQIYFLSAPEAVVIVI